MPEIQWVTGMPDAVKGRAYCGDWGGDVGKTCKIALNYCLYETNNSKAAEESLAHELAHYVVYMRTGTFDHAKGGHGREWKRLMKKWGYRDHLDNWYNDEHRGNTQVFRSRDSQSCL